MKTSKKIDLDNRAMKNFTFRAPIWIIRPLEDLAFENRVNCSEVVREVLSSFLVPDVEPDEKFHFIYKNKKKDTETYDLNLISEVNSLKEQLKESEKRILELDQESDKIKSLEDVIEESYEKITNLEDRIKSKDSMILKLNSECLNRDNDIHDHKTRIEELESEKKKYLV